MQARAGGAALQPTPLCSTTAGGGGGGSGRLSLSLMMSSGDIYDDVIPDVQDEDDDSAPYSGLTLEQYMLRMVTTPASAAATSGGRRGLRGRPGRGRGPRLRW